MDVKFPDVNVQLTGADGNVFVIIGEVSRALKKAGHREEARMFTGDAMSCGSYDEVLQLCLKTVNVS